MKKSTILSFLHNDIDIHERLFVPLSQSETKQAADEVYTKLEKVLSKDYFDLFNEFIDKGYEIKHEEIQKYFSEGFKIGLRIGIECLDD